MDGFAHVYAVRTYIRTTGTARHRCWPGVAATSRCPADAGANVSSSARRPTLGRHVARRPHIVGARSYVRRAGGRGRVCFVFLSASVTQVGCCPRACLLLCCQSRIARLRLAPGPPSSFSLWESPEQADEPNKGRRPSCRAVAGAPAWRALLGASAWCGAAIGWAARHHLSTAVKHCDPAQVDLRPKVSFRLEVAAKPYCRSPPRCAGASGRGSAMGAEPAICATAAAAALRPWRSSKTPTVCRSLFTSGPSVRSAW